MILLSVHTSTSVYIPPLRPVRMQSYPSMQATTPAHKASLSPPCLHIWLILHKLRWQTTRHGSAYMALATLQADSACPQTLTCPFLLPHTPQAPHTTHLDTEACIQDYKYSYTLPFRWQTTRHGSAYVALATQAAGELRRALAKQYPPVSHVWQRVEAVQLHSPLLCTACFLGVHPESTHVVRSRVQLGWERNVGQRIGLLEEGAAWVYAQRARFGAAEYRGRHMGGCAAALAPPLHCFLGDAGREHACGAL